MFLQPTSGKVSGRSHINADAQTYKGSESSSGLASFCSGLGGGGGCVRRGKNKSVRYLTAHPAGFFFYPSPLFPSPRRSPIVPSEANKGVHPTGHCHKSNMYAHREQTLQTEKKLQKKSFKRALKFASGRHIQLANHFKIRMCVPSQCHLQACSSKLKVKMNQIKLLV